MVHHRTDRLDGDAMRNERAQVDQKCRKTLGASPYLIARHSAGEEHHEVGMLGARSPYFLAVDDIKIAVTNGLGAKRQRVRAAGRFGDAEGLQSQRTISDAREIFLLLLG